MIRDLKMECEALGVTEAELEAVLAGAAAGGEEEEEGVEVRCV